MENASYDREMILKTARDRLNGTPFNSYYASICALVHRFLKLSDAFCLLIDNRNALSAQALLRPMLDCVMRLFINSAFVERSLDWKTLNGQRLSDVWVCTPWPDKFEYKNGKGEVRLTDSNIAIFMECLGFKNIKAFYGKLCKYTHFSNFHYADLFRSKDIIAIGGDDTELQSPIITDALADFGFVQKAFVWTLRFC